jgi:hypothetical protein
MDNTFKGVMEIMTWLASYPRVMSSARSSQCRNRQAPGNHLRGDPRLKVAGTIRIGQATGWVTLPTIQADSRAALRALTQLLLSGSTKDAPCVPPYNISRAFYAESRIYWQEQHVIAMNLRRCIHDDASAIEYFVPHKRIFALSTADHFADSRIGAFEVFVHRITDRCATIQQSGNGTLMLGLVSHR